MPNTRNVTWNEIQQSINVLYDALCNEFFKYQKFTHLTFYGVSKGGIIPATLLAKLWGNSTVAVISSFAIKAQPYCVYDIIVDDICDSGKTLSMVKSKCIGNPKILTLFRRYNSEIDVDKYAELITNDDWIIFPWEDGVE